MKSLVGLISVAVLLASASCAEPSASTPPAISSPPTSPFTISSPATGTLPHSGPDIFIQADGSINKPSFLPDEDILIELSFKNVTTESIKMEPFPPVIQIVRASPYDQVVRTFPAGTDSESLTPGKAVGYALSWNQHDDQGQQMPDGHYYLRLGRIRLGDRWVSISLHDPISVLIVPDGGVIEKSVRVNQSQTVDGITITLEQVELTPWNTIFYAFNTPSDYHLPQGTDKPPPDMFIDAEAEYSLDGSPTRPAGRSAISFFEEGMRHIWGDLDPIPRGTGELTFIITKFGDRVGPWTYYVTLD